MGELNSNVTVVVGDEPTTSTVPNPRKAHIAGGNAVLFRFNDPAERALASLGLYTKSPTESPAPSPTESVAVEWPSIPENGVVDLESVSLYVVDGLLQYYFDGTVGTVPNAGVNILQTSDLVFVSNNAEDRDGVFFDRDCQVGDVVVITVGDTSIRTSIVEIRVDNTGENKLLVFRDNLPADIRAAASVALSLYIVVDGVEVPRLKEEAPGEFNYTFDENGIVIADEITMFEASWTDNGIEQALTLTEGELIVQYRAWVNDKINAVFTCGDVTDLELIPGALHPANPLKWGVYAALQNSAGVAVKYTAVANPSDLDDWGDMLDWLGDDKDIYALVPLTNDSDVWDLYETYITTQRAAGHPLCMRVCPSFVDDIVVYEDLDATITEVGGTNTLVTATGGQFITDGVSVGDTVDFEFEEDAWDITVYSSATVVEVMSEQSLRISTGPDTEVTVADRIRIRRASTAANITTRLQALAANFNSRYIQLIWPDTVTISGQSCAGYYLAAALAGLRSGVYPHQGLTNMELTGVSVDSRMVLLNVTQRVALMDAGVWVVNATSAGNVVTRRGVTTAQTDELEYREEAVVSNIDGIEYDIRRIISEYKGKSNITQTILRHVRIAVKGLFIKLGGDVSVELGARILAGTLNSVSSSVNSGNIVVNYAVTVPTPFNKLEIVQQITVGITLEVTE